ncbi:winged helix-turn-helix transcriptional regulator [Candidatus Micrarchaeota archaeon]|nr:winged helix-turn-helix transcriptional regulator [Candidatus Micrarchaeota archaeon]
MDGRKQVYVLHAQLCETLANPKRLEIIDALGGGRISVSEIMKRTGLAQSNLSQHLALLRQRGVVRAERNGRSVRYSLAYPETSQACALMRRVLMKQLKEGENLARKMR